MGALRDDSPCFPSPSKIPYGGFSPVRLQTGFRPRPSSHEARTYTRPESSTSRPQMAPCGQAVGVGVPRSQALRSRGPWLANGLCCPARSSLTMASSEPLAALPTSYFLRPSGHLWRRVGPQFKSACLFVRAIPSTPVDRIGCIRLLLPRPQWSSPISQRLDIHIPTLVGSRVARNEADKVRLRYGPHDG